MAEVTQEELQEQWPGWKIWCTETLWNATRRHPRPELPDGLLSSFGHLVVTLMEDGPDDLITALQGQAAIEAAIDTAAHVGEHPVGPACPLSCLGLSVGTDQALRDHWARYEKTEPTVGDLFALRENDGLRDVPYVGRARVAEINSRFDALQVPEPA